MFRIIKNYRCILNISVLSAILAASGCATRNASSVVNFLYPYTKNPVVTPGIPILSLPIRVGIAFVPGGGSYSNYNIFALTENRKMDLMQQVADHFKKYPFVKSVEIIPSAYLKDKGGFPNLDKIRTMYGIDIIALVSYDQAQFTDQELLSLSYWTSVGAYVVHGEINDTYTMLDTVVLDIGSKNMLFHAPGLSHIKWGETPINQSEQLRLDSDAGFTEASNDMITNLEQQLALFQDKMNKAR